MAVHPGNGLNRDIGANTLYMFDETLDIMIKFVD